MHAAMLSNRTFGDPVNIAVASIETAVPANLLHKENMPLTDPLLCGYGCSKTVMYAGRMQKSMVTNIEQGTTTLKAPIASTPINAAETINAAATTNSAIPGCARSDKTEVGK
jgi:hypothetical protein